MSIKNYTSTVKPRISIAEIQEALSEAGAEKIVIDYQDKKPVSVMFSLETAAGVKAFVLPANIDGVLAVFKKQKINSGREQAEITAWRNIRDWVLAQMAIVECGLATADQVFLPYLSDGTKTLYDMFCQGRLMLPKGE